MTNPSFTQTRFRIRNDNGTEGSGSGSATWRQAEDANDTITIRSASSPNFRVRFQIDETASRAWSNKTFNLYYSVASASSTYSAVTAATPIQFVASSYFTDGDDCTALLTAPTGTFVTDNNGMKETTGGAVNSGAAGQYFETEWCLVLDYAQVTSASTFDLRIYDSTNALTAYSTTPRISLSKVPSLTINAPTNATSSDNITLTYHPPTFTLTVQGASHTTYSDNLALTYHTPHYTLTVQQSDNATASGNIALTQHQAILVNGSDNQTSSDKVSLVINLLVQQADNTTYSDNIVFSGMADIQTWMLIMTAM